MKTNLPPTSSLLCAIPLLYHLFGNSKSNSADRLQQLSLLKEDRKGNGEIKKTTVLPLVSTVEKTIIMSGP